MNNIHKQCLVLNRINKSAIRQVQTNASVIENCKEIINRNPRNLEMMRIARKPVGYHLNKQDHVFWNKLFIKTRSRNVEAGICHFKNGPIVTVSTKEWALKRQLHSTSDVSAYANLGKVLSQRCLECGITSVRCDIDSSNSTKYTSFLEEMKKGGITLLEPPIYKQAHPWDQDRMVKPWTVEETL